MLRRAVILICFMFLSTSVYAQELQWKASSLLSDALRQGKTVIYGKDHVASAALIHEIYKDQASEERFYTLNIAALADVEILWEGSIAVSAQDPINVATSAEGQSLVMESHPSLDGTGTVEQHITNRPHFLRNASSWVVILDAPSGDVKAALEELQARSEEAQQLKTYQAYKAIGAFQVVEQGKYRHSFPMLRVDDLSDLRKVLSRRKSGGQMSETFINSLPTAFGKNLAKQLIDPGCGNEVLDTEEQCDGPLFRPSDVSKHGADNLSCTNCLLTVKEYCGNGTCHSESENSQDCPADCSCPLKPCDSNGSYSCVASLKGNSCSYNCESCPPVECGDTICSNSAGESKDSCPKDCGCPEVLCPEGETGSCSNTYSDYLERCDTTCSCQPVDPTPAPRCGDARCDIDESCASCTTDCGTCADKCAQQLCFCNDLTSVPCIAGETGECEPSLQACAALCESTTITCPMGDNIVTGQFRDGKCVYDTSTCAGTTIPICGDYTCNQGESCEFCPQDCGPCSSEEPKITCGNDRCDSGESCETCSVDCGTCAHNQGGCGDSVCSPEEQANLNGCPADCFYPYIINPGNTLCGNGSCEQGEECLSCPADCGSCDARE